MKTISGAPPAYFLIKNANHPTNDQLCCSVCSLICNIFFAFCGGIFFIPCSIASTVFSCIARSKLIDGNAESGRSKARVAFTLNLINIITGLVWWLFLIIIFIMIIAGSGYFVLKMFQLPEKIIQRYENKTWEILGLVLAYIFDPERYKE